MFLFFLITNGNDYNLIKWNYSSVHRHNFHPELEWKRCVVWNLRKGQDYRTSHYINTIVNCDRQPVFFDEIKNIHRYNPDEEAVREEMSLLDVMIANGGYHPQEAEEFEENITLPTEAIN